MRGGKTNGLWYEYTCLGALNGGVKWRYWGWAYEEWLLFLPRKIDIRFMDVAGVGGGFAWHVLFYDSCLLR